MDMRFEPQFTRWSVLHNGALWAQFEFSLAGEYNVLNATAAAAMASHFGITPAQVAEALRTFRSVKRRLEVRAEVAGVTIIDDFAHHPTAIAQTLTALRKRYAGRRLWAVLEPRSNTLVRNFFQRELGESLALADEVVIADVYRSSKIPAEQRLDLDVLMRDLGAKGRPAHHYADADEIVKAIAPELRSGDVVAVLSNGGFGNIYEKLPRAISERRA
jgi:UDP-N-acetylmuramate: L-alanyl-gamma-D-glutamyl-meso-diaminopimelate ligase